ncbi:MAG: hypothetical protein K6F14_09275 [Clostridiales bacterium]|nr:hypothetical protein [Clostridiales bacterium]
MKTRTLALILSVVMVLSIVFFTVSCSSGTQVTTTASEKTEARDTTETTTAVVTEDVTTETTEDVTTEPTGHEKLAGYEDVDFGGMTFLIATDPRDDQDWANHADFWVEGITNDAINDAVHERNDVFEHLYNCKIEIDDGGWANGFNASIASGDGKYILGTYSSTGTASLSKSGNYYNLLKLDVDWTQPWWDQNYIMDTSTDGRLYTVIGDYALHSMSATWIMFFNKDVYESKFADINIYQMVKEKKWTLDVMVDFIEKIRYDANGDSEYTFSEEADADIVGLMTTAHNDRGMFFAAGMRYVTKTENSVNGSYVSALATQQGASDVIDKLIKVGNTPGYISGGYTNARIAVQNGTTLFCGEVMDVLRRMAGSDNLRVGVLPQPLFDENQEAYHCYVNDQAYITVAPIGFSNMSVLSDFLTLFTYHSSKLVRPAYVNTIKYSYTSDEDSAEMIDIVLDSRVYDVGYVCKFSVSMDGYVSTMISSGKNNYTKAAASYSTKDTATLDEYRAALLAIDDNY